MRSRTISITIDAGRITVFTDYRPWIRRLKQLEVERPAHVALLSEGPAGAQFIAPIDWFKINPSRRYSKESRQQLRRRCIENCQPALEEKRRLQSMQDTAKCP